MIRVYLKNSITSRPTKTDDVCKLLYVEINTHPFSPIPICWDGIEPENVSFLTFGQQFTGDAQRGLYKTDDRRCEAHVTGGANPHERQVLMRAPTFELIKEMWEQMCTGELEPYKKM
jgi:hypothetical protein